MKLVKHIVVLLVIIGGINWGLVGAFDYNLVAALFGDKAMITRIIYVLVGLAAVYKLFLLLKDVK